MKEKNINLSMELISIAGDSKSTALMAIEVAKNKEANKAFEMLEKAKTELRKIHRLHADLLSQEANGEEFEINLLFVHAEDHFANAIVVLELAEHIINLYLK